jgi:hypothetical protein
MIRLCNTAQCSNMSMLAAHSRDDHTFWCGERGDTAQEVAAAEHSLDFWSVWTTRVAEPTMRNGKDTGLSSGLPQVAQDGQ